MLKPEITQKVKFVHSRNTHQDVMANQSPVAIPGQPSGLSKLASLSGNRRSRTSAVILGLAVSMGISSFPANDYTGATTMAAASAPNSVTPVLSTSDLPSDRSISTGSDFYVRQLRSEIAVARTQQELPTTTLVAQAMPTRTYPMSVANRNEANNLQFGSEVSVPIEVPAPKTKTFKPVSTHQAYYNPEVPAEGELYHSGDKTPSNRTGETTLGFTWPATGTVTSRFGRRWGRMHKGIDIAGPIGTPINAAADGVVIVAGWSSGGYGNLVEIKHSDGTTTRYGHNSQLSVSVGQSVRQGQQIAAMGSTGHSTGSHLHFEIRPSGGNAVNPIAHLPSNS